MEYIGQRECLILFKEFRKTMKLDGKHALKKWRLFKWRMGKIDHSDIYIYNTQTHTLGRGMEKSNMLEKGHPLQILR